MDYLKYKLEVPAYEWRRIIKVSFSDVFHHQKKIQQNIFQKLMENIVFTNDGIPT